LLWAKELTRPVIVAPSSGSVPRAKKFREVLSEKWGGAEGGGEVDLAMLIEHQYHEVDSGGRLVGPSSQLDLVGDVAGRDCIIVEDIVDTASTITRAAEELKRKGARDVYAFASHGLFSDNALDRIAASELREVVVTNTVPMSADDDGGGKVTQLTLAPLLAESIKRIHLKQSILSLFELHGTVEGAEEKKSG
jgi:ribose-phosphate pyrophosphokinase